MLSKVGVCLIGPLSNKLLLKVLIATWGNHAVNLFQLLKKATLLSWLQI